MDSDLELVISPEKTKPYHCFAFDKVFFYCKEKVEKKGVFYKIKGRIILSDEQTIVEILNIKGKADTKTKNKKTKKQKNKKTKKQKNKNIKFLQAVIVFVFPRR